jgi:hypothetical protein
MVDLPPIPGHRDYKRLKTELELSRELGRKLQRLVWKDFSKIEPFSFELSITYLLFLRAERTFASIRLLAKLGHVDDAFALVRVFVEKVINAEYIFFAGTEAALDYLQFGSFKQWKDLEELTDFDQNLVPKHSEDFRSKLKKMHDAAEFKQLPNGKKIKRYGRGHDWTELGLSKRAAFVDAAFASRLNQPNFGLTQTLFYSTFKKGAVYLHGTWDSIARSLEQDMNHPEVITGDNDRASLSVGIKLKDKNPKIAAEAIVAADICAASMLMFFDKAFGKKVYTSWLIDFHKRRVAHI